MRVLIPIKEKKVVIITIALEQIGLLLLHITVILELDLLIPMQDRQEAALQPNLPLRQAVVLVQREVQEALLAVGKPLEEDNFTNSI